MGDRKVDMPTHAIEQITPELKTALNEAKSKLKGSDRRQFMAQIVVSLGPGGQRRAQRELGLKIQRFEPYTVADHCRGVCSLHHSKQL